MSNYEVCETHNVVEGVCTECGLEISKNYFDMTSSYSEYHSHFDISNIQPFEQDLKNLTIPDEIKNHVMKLAMSCPKETHRMGVRKQQLFSYIYLAYLQLGYKFDHDKLIEEMGMDKRKINMALRIVSGTSSADIPLPIDKEEGEIISAPVVIISPIVYIEDLCKENNLKESFTDIHSYAKNILSKNKMLLEFNPKHIAIAIIRHYLNHHDMDIPKKFARNNGISESILKTHMNRIINI